MAIETEVKLRLPDSAAAARVLLDGLGYRPRAPRVLEVDQLYDRSDGELKSSDRVLRLRASGDQCVLTYKGPSRDGPYKSREEIELRLSDGAAMEYILQALGYHLAFRYEKYRTIFAFEGEAGVIALDETPMGDFLELEGPGDWIESTTVKLGFSTMDYISSTYYILYQEYKKKHPSLPHNMLFLQTDSAP